MPINIPAYQRLVQELNPAEVTLVAVSKTKPASDVQELYDLGHRDFGENYVQELSEKYELLPKDIRWHFIGHLQTNKAKYIVPFVYLIHGIDSLKLLVEVNKQAGKNNRVIDCLLQMFIAQEETKFGLDDEELDEIITQYNHGNFPNIRLRGLMAMATLTDDKEQIRREFAHLRSLYDRYKDKLPAWDMLSMGMSADYPIALEYGSNMVRIGSMLFGEWVYAK